MQSEDYKFTIVKANKTDLDVRKQMGEIFAEGFTQWLVFFSKDKNIIAKAFAHMFILDQFYVAIANGEIAGVTACTDGKTLSVRLNKKELRKHLGFFKGSMAGIFLKKEFEAALKISLQILDQLSLLEQLRNSVDRVSHLKSSKESL